eukprot:10743256-Ditylum_brightwellii.AAC.1
MVQKNKRPRRRTPNVRVSIGRSDRESINSNSDEGFNSGFEHTAPVISSISSSSVNGDQGIRIFSPQLE